MKKIIVVIFALSIPQFACANEKDILRDACAAIKQAPKRNQCFTAIESLAKQGGQGNTSTIAKSTLRALRLLAGSTEMGVSLSDYNKLVLENVSVIDEATRSLPDSDFKASIIRSRDAFTDARTLWSSMFAADYVSIFLSANRQILEKYPIDADYVNALQRASTFAKTENMNKSLILTPVWAVAKGELKKAEDMSAHQ